MVTASLFCVFYLLILKYAEKKKYWTMLDLIIVGMVSENSLVTGNNNVPATSNTMAPNNARYEDMVWF